MGGAHRYAIFAFQANIYFIVKCYDFGP